MANHHAAATAALLLTASLLVAVALSGADARPTVLPDKTLAALPSANDVEGRDVAAAAVVDPDCDDDGKPKHHKHHHHHGHDDEDNNNPDHPMHSNQPGESPYLALESVDQELCSDCEEPKTPEPPCNTCEEPKEAEMTCNKVHAVRDGETCYSIGQCAELGQDDFLRFNPNICCDHLFVGQWVCLDATCAD